MGSPVIEMKYQAFRFVLKVWIYSEFRWDHGLVIVRPMLIYFSVGLFYLINIYYVNSVK